MDLSELQEMGDYRRKVRAAIAAIMPDEWGGSFLALGDEAENIRFQRDWDARLAEAGLRGVAWPAAYGGQGFTLLEHFVVSEELGRAAAPEGINVVGTELAAPILLAAGTEAQKRHFIPRIIRSEDVWCQGFSEPNSGSDLASLRTSAAADGNAWRINGQKVWTSLANASDWCLLLARTDPSATKHRGLSLFAVPMDTPGIDVRVLRQITGHPHFSEMFFDNVRVAAENLLGPLNEGWRVATEVLSIERGTNRMFRQARFVHEFTHMAQLLLEQIERDGSGGVSALRQELAAVWSELSIHRLHILKLVSRVLAGERIGPEVSINKLFWSEMHQRLARLGAEILGSGINAEGRGAASAGRFQELYLQSRSETIYAGTSQIQRNIIAERLLGLPR